VAGIIFAGAYIITDGHWWINIIRSNQNEYITEQFIGLFKQFLGLHWPILMLAALVVLYETYFARLSIYSMWFVISLASTLGAGKWGAGDSYFATTLASACLLSGIFITHSLNQSWQFRKTYLAYMTNLPIPAKAFAIFGLVLVTIYGITVIKFPTSGPIFGPLAATLNVEPKPGHRYPLYDAADWTVGYAVTGHFPTANDV
jgi:hypothetical protein